MLKYRTTKVILTFISVLFVSNSLVHIFFEANKKQIKLTTMDYDDIFGDITVISPNNLDVLKIGDKFTIKWNSMGGIEYVTIALYRRSEFVDCIATATKNDGSYDWVVGEYEEGKDYSIGIWDYYDFNVCDFSDNFEIVSKFIFHLDPIITLFVIVGSLIGIGGIITVLTRRCIFEKKRISCFRTHSIKIF